MTGPAPRQARGGASTSAPQLSALILTLNEADRVVPCLESLRGWVDEIVVLDSGSTDDTVEICRRYTDHVLQTDWPGEGIQRQRSLAAARGEWILYIDADERVSPALRAEIEAIIAAPPGRISQTGFTIPWETLYFGGRCIHGGLGDRHIRLFRRSAARFAPDVLVHPKPLLEPRRVGALRGRLIHESFRDFEHLLHKNVDYALRGAAQMLGRGRAGASVFDAATHSLWRFVQLYFVRLGLLDGSRGFVNAVLAAQYVFNKYAAVWSDKATRDQE